MKFLMFILSVILTGCSFNKCDNIIIERPKLQLKDPNVLTLKSVKFKVLHRDNASNYFNDSDKAVFVLTESEYKNLALNMEKLKAYIKSQKKIIQLYRNYYESKSNGKSK